MGARAPMSDSQEIWRLRKPAWRPPSAAAISLTSSNWAEGLRSMKLATVSITRA